MSPHDKAAVKRFANGDASVRKECERIYWDNVSGDDRNTLEMDYLSEVFSDIPDLALRALYRSLLIQGGVKISP